MSVPETARTHQEERARLATLAARSATATWDRIDPDLIPQSWRTLAPAAVAATSAAQRAAAQTADTYLDTIAPGLPAAGRIAPTAYAGVASDGRSLESLLLTPISPVLSAIATGNPVPLALASGRLLLELLVRTMVADAGRGADQTAMAARPAITGYVRVVHPGACSRCIVLAGREYRWNAEFDRHPRCQCTQAPLFHSNRLTRAITPSEPQEIFESLPPAEQDRVFGVAGAEAIRAGADIDQVVNARRGMDTATVYGRSTRVTTEGTTVRGVAARRMGGPTARLGRRYRELTTPRLMPEQILADAEDRDDAIRLLRRFGYLAGADPDERRDDDGPVELTRTASEREQEPAAGQAPAPDLDTEPERELDASESEPDLAAEPAEPLRGGDVDRAVPSWNDDHFDGDTQAAFESYKDFLYQSINERLRTGEINPADTEDVEDWIARMRAGFGALPATTESVLVHRGVPDIDTLFGPPGSRIGRIFRDKAFVSTTTDAAFAEELGAFGGNPSIINILVPSGSKALRLDTGDDDQEFEILLPDDSRFRVVDDRIEDGKRVVDLELLPDSGGDEADDQDAGRDLEQASEQAEPEPDVDDEAESAGEDDEDFEISPEEQAEIDRILRGDDREIGPNPQGPGTGLATTTRDTPLRGEDAYRHAPFSRGEPFTNQESRKLYDYTGTPAMAMNFRKRHGEWFTGTTDEQARELTEHMEIMRGAFAKAPPSVEWIEVLRGTGRPYEELFGPVGSMLGGVFRDPAFVSTSAKPLPGFTTGRVRILLPPGSRPIALGEAEWELLLPDDARFRVLVDELDEDGDRQIVLEYLP